MLRELYALSAAPVRQQKRNKRHEIASMSISEQQLKAKEQAAPFSLGMQEQIQAVFEILDTDNSGTVDEQELVEAMFALGLTREGSGRDDIAQLIAKVTADSGTSGDIDLTKFSAIMQVSKHDSPASLTSYVANFGSWHRGCC
jgi:Ca2+-binding EF-hand superfamily protein